MKNTFLTFFIYSVVISTSNVHLKYTRAISLLLHRKSKSPKCVPVLVPYGMHGRVNKVFHQRTLRGYNVCH